MRICDKCGKKLREGDGSSHIKLGYPFNFDVCKECEQKFLSHVASFFNEEENEEADK